MRRQASYEKPLAGAIKTSTFVFNSPRYLVVKLVVRLWTSFEKSKRRTKRPRSPRGAYACTDGQTARVKPSKFAPVMYGFS